MPTLTPTQKTSRRRTLAGLILAGAALAAPHVARAAVRAARFGHNNPNESHYGQGAIVFAKAVAADPVLAPVLKIDIFPEAQLGDDMAMLKACAAGTLDGAFVSTGVSSNIVPQLGVINAPYIFPSIERARAVLDGPIGRELAELSRAKGLPVLAFGENGLRHMTANKPVRSPADLRGLKIRVPQVDVMVNGFRAFGADAKPLAFPLLKDAIRSGEFQAQENGIGVIETGKLYEVQKYLCLTSHAYDSISFIASADLLEDLTEPQRAALAAAARKGAAVSRQAADAFARDGIARLKAAGMTVVDDVDVEAFRALARPFLEGLGATYGQDRVRALLNAGV
jgi:hypothetical protein